MGSDVMRWDGMGWHGMAWHGMECDEIGWNDQTGLKFAECNTMELCQNGKKWDWMDGMAPHVI